MSATKIKDIVLPALAKFWAKIEVQINELKENLSNLSNQMQSFENTKSNLVGSALGKALSLTSTSTWANIVSKIKGVITKLSGSTTIAADKMGWDSTNNLWCYIPVNAFYSTAHWLQLKNADVAAKIGLTAAKIVTGNTILGIAGTNKGYDAGYSAGKSATVPVFKRIESSWFGQTPKEIFSYTATASQHVYVSGAIQTYNNDFNNYATKNGTKISSVYGTDADRIAWVFECDLAKGDVLKIYTGDHYSNGTNRFDGVCVIYDK